MADRDKVTGLGRLLGSVAEEHHRVTGGAGEHWVEWYADHLRGVIDSFVGSEPTLGEIEEWLRLADERYRAETPETRWPFFYAELILDSLALDA